MNQKRDEEKNLQSTTNHLTGLHPQYGMKMMFLILYHLMYREDMNCLKGNLRINLSVKGQDLGHHEALDQGHHEVPDPEPPKGGILVIILHIACPQVVRQCGQMHLEEESMALFLQGDSSIQEGVDHHAGLQAGGPPITKVLLPERCITPPGAEGILLELKFKSLYLWRIDHFPPQGGDIPGDPPKI